MEKKKKVAIYARVSTVEQAEEGYSIDEQERLLREYCEKHDLDVYKAYSDRGISGKDIKHRPELKEMLKDSEENKFDMVLVWKINRLSRKLADVLKMVELFDKNNVTFKSYSEPFETNTPAGKMQFQMMALIGEFERGTIAQNVKMGMLARAREGKWCGNRVLGYDIVPVERSLNKKRKETKLVINEKEADIVRLIFNEYSNGNGYKAITNKLNKLGYKTKKGNNFSVGSIKDILTNPVYIGKIRYNVRQDWSEKRRKNINPNPIIVDGLHDAIISEELWDKVQKILESKKGKPARIYDGEYPLTGILRCPVCGAGMVIMRTTNKLKDGTKKRITYYACGNWKNKGTAVCNSNAIRVDKANGYVFGKIEELLSNEKMIKSIIENINNTRRSNVEPNKKKLDKIDKELIKLKSKKTKILEAYEDDLITKEELVERKSELDKNISTLEEERQKLLITVTDENQTEVSYDVIKEILQSFGRIMSNCTSREKQKTLLHMLVSEITIGKDREIDSIKLKINDGLIDYLSNEEEVPMKGASSFLMQHFRFGRMNINLII
ncbi:recombinase family protein [Clostridium perfringens]|uniref:recombinase family protein n=1 Tax=Clostridium perfringens TaxID=1502 RepID=UPI0039E8C106